MSLRASNVDQNLYPSCKHLEQHLMSTFLKILCKGPMPFLLQTACDQIMLSKNLTLSLNVINFEMLIFKMLNKPNSEWQ